MANQSSFTQLLQKLDDLSQGITDLIDAINQGNGNSNGNNGNNPYVIHNDDTFNEYDGHYTTTVENCIL